MITLTDQEATEISNYMREESFNPGGHFKIVEQKGLYYILRYWSETEEFDEAFSVKRNEKRRIEIGDATSFEWDKKWKEVLVI